MRNTIKQTGALATARTWASRAGAVTVIGVSLLGATLGTAHAGQAIRSTVTAAAVATASDCLWVTRRPAAVYAKNGHGQWYHHHTVPRSTDVRGPSGHVPEGRKNWVRVYMGVGGEGLMRRKDLWLRGACHRS